MLPIIITAIIITLLIADVFFVEFESFGWTTASLIVTGAAIYYFNLWGFPAWVKANGPLCFAFAGAYIVVGVIWSFIKWYSYLVSYRDQFTEIKDRFNKANKDLIDSQWQWVQDNHITAKEVIRSIVTTTNEIVNKGTLPFSENDLLYNDYTSKIKNGHDLNVEFRCAKREYATFHKPEASSNKSKIIAWICYWPFSLIGTFINDPIRRLVNFLFTKLKATYQKMSDKVFKDFP